MPGMQTLLQTAITAALQAGKAILDIYDDPASDFEIEHKADHSPLTIADRVSNEIILKQLKNTPYPVISEENKATAYAIRKQWQTVWIVDPLDGTKEFIKRNGEFTVNIALVYGGRPALGVIYIPVKKELYFADKEFGAYKVSEISSLAEDMTLDKLMAQGVRLPYATGSERPFTIVASRSHLSPETEAYIEEMKQKHSRIEIASKGSSLKLCLIAEGKADVYPRFAPTMEWDTAAGHAIIRATGKEVWQADTRCPLQYNKTDLLNPWFIAE